MELYSLLFYSIIGQQVLMVWYHGDSSSVVDFPYVKQQLRIIYRTSPFLLDKMKSSTDFPPVWYNLVHSDLLDADPEEIDRHI